MNSKFNNFPAQKISDFKKTKEWFKKNIDSVDSSGFFLDEGIRASFKNRKINYDLYNGKVDIKDVLAVINPNDIKGLNTQEKLQHYPIAVPRINVLLGEELKRRFDYRVILTNPDSVSLKEENKLNMFKEHIMNFLETNYKEKELEAKLKDLEEYSEYHWQDYREALANNILRHLYQEQKLDLIFNEGFLDALIAGEEYYIAEIVSGEPVLRRINTNSVFWLRSGFSNKIDDSDLIVIDEYWSPGRIVDTYYDQLKSSEIDYLQTSFAEGGGDPFKAKNTEPPFILAESSEDINVINSLVDMAAQGHTLNSSMDAYGNLRVLRVFWRSFRKVKNVKFYDEFGDEQYEIYPDSYEPDESKGESATTLWINEWLEGTKIGDDIYVNLRPKPIQYGKLDNPSYCHPGITGRTYSIATNQTVSLMDRLKAYQYLYDVTFDRLNKLIANNKGKVLNMDFSAIPEEWEPEQWFTYLSTMNIAVKDSFRESAKGSSVGKIVGNLGRGGDHTYIDLDQSQGIQNYIGLLEFIKQQMTEISGVTDQRLGQIENRETIGGVERSITQSSNITEWYFFQHEKIKLEALRLLLDTAKIAYKDKSKKVQYILDEQSIQMLNIDGDDLSSHEYGLVLTTSSKSLELDQTIQQGAYALMQRGELELSTLLDVFASTSLSEKRKKIEKKEKAKSEEDARRFNEDLEARTAAEEKSYNLEIMKLELEDLKNQRDNLTKLQTSIPEDNSLDREKFEADKTYKEKEFSEKKRQFDEKLKVEYKKLAQPKTSK
jgi:hypothetical protein